MKNLLKVVSLMGTALIMSFPFSSAFAAPNGVVAPHPGKISKPSVNGAYFVSFEDNRSRSDIIMLIHSAGGKVKFNYRYQNVVAAYIPFENINFIQGAGSVTSVIPDQLITAIGKPEGKGGKPPKEDTGGQTVPEGVMRIGAYQVGNYGYGVGVAIVDTGIDFSHADLSVSSDCFTAYGASCNDDNGHGTHVAGIVAAIDNSADVIGVAPDATLYSVKVLDVLGFGYDSDIISGLEWIYEVSDGLNGNDVDTPIRVVNMSLGRKGSLDDGNLNDTPPLRTAISNLTDIGISVVVAAGNDPSLKVSENVPATYPEVMAVASTTAIDGKSKCRFHRQPILADTASYFTTDGAYDADTGIGVTISAPGDKREDISGGCFIEAEGILSTQLGGGTARMFGTSMASPHVAGAVAVMWSKALTLDKESFLDPEFIKTTIRETAEFRGNTPIDSPSVSYTFDGEREGVISVPDLLDAL